MTDNEIIKALEHCSDGTGKGIIKATLDLIKSKDEQIEGLIAGQETLQKALNEKIAEAERLNKGLLKSKIFKFARNPNRIYNVMDFQDDEILRFYDYPDKPSAVSQGYYFFQGKEDIRLININEVKELSCNEIKSEAVKEFAERLKGNKIDIDVSFGYGREVYTEAVAVIEIDNLVKEMVGEG